VAELLAFLVELIEGLLRLMLVPLRALQRLLRRRAARARERRAGSGSRHRET